MATYPNPKSVFLTQHCQKGLLGIIGNSPEDSAFELQFSYDSKATDKKAIAHAAKEFDWEPKLTSSFLMTDIKGFEFNLWSDKKMTTDMKVVVSHMIPFLERHLKHVEIIQEYWSYIKTNVTKDIVHCIEKHAKVHKVPLVKES